MKIKKFIAGAAVAVLATLGIGLTAQSASAHTPEAWATCEAVFVKATNYETKPATQEQTSQKLVSEAVPYQPAVYGEKPVIYPAVEYKPAVYETEYEYRHTDNGNGNSNKTRWEREGWNAGPNGKGWVPTGNTRPGKLISAEVPAKEAVYGEAPLISPEVLAKDAVYETVVTVPASPADSTPNNVTITVDGVEVLNQNFGHNFEDSVALDKTVAHTWSVTITAWNDPQGYNGWTKTISGTTTPCITEVPPVDFDKLSGTIVVDCKAETVTFTAKNENDVAVTFLTQFDANGDGTPDSGDGFEVGANSSDTSVYDFSLFAPDSTLTAYLLVADGEGTHEVAKSAEFSTKGCAEVPPAPANPTAVITAVCGAADIVLTNPVGENANQITASFVVHVDGKVYDTPAVVAGESQEIHLTFPEDSGDHTVEVFQAGTSEWKSIAKETVKSDCIVPKPENKVVFGDWVTGKYECGDTTVQITRTQTSTEYVREGAEWVEGESVTTTQTETRDLTDAEIEALDCAVVVPPTEEPKPQPSVTPTPAPKPVAAENTDGALAATGNDPMVTLWALTGGSLMVALGALSILFAARRRQLAQQGTTED